MAVGEPSALDKGKPDRKAGTQRHGTYDRQRRRSGQPGYREDLRHGWPAQERHASTPASVQEDPMLAILRKRLHRDDEDSTLIELMVVVLISAIFVALAIPTFLGAQDRARDRSAQ